MAQYITLLEARERHEHIATDGAEIICTYYVEPYTAAPIVISALLGGVTGNTKESLRVLPINDHDYPFCYCVQANRTPMDQRAIAGGPSLLRNTSDDDWGDVRDALPNAFVFNGELSLNPAGRYKQPDDTSGQCGAYIEAVFRPLVTVYSGSNRTRSFDYVDPQFYPAFRTLAVDTALKMGLDNAGIPVLKRAAQFDIGAADSWIKETWQDLSIRRVMCPSVSWQTINKSVNCINDEDWTPDNFTLPQLPSGVFPRGSLRYDGAEVVKHVVPSAVLYNDPSDPGNVTILADRDDIPITRPMVWWDITHKFSWRTIWHSSYDLALKKLDPHWLSWNDCYGGPWAGGLIPPGWYAAGFRGQPFSQERNKYMNVGDSLGDTFDALFKLDAA